MDKLVNLSSLWKDINKSNSETKEISIQVLEQLERQKQSIINSNKNVNNSNNLLDNSNEVLNTMSWVGWFKSFIPFKSFFSRLLRKNNREILFITNEPIDYKITPIALSSQYELDKRPSLLQIKYEYNPSDNNKNNENNEELKNLENELNDLLWIGTKIGEHLDLHNNYLDTMNEKTQILFDKTKKSTKKTNDFL